MKLLYIVADGNLGGGSTHVTQLIQAYRAKGFYTIGLITQKKSDLAKNSAGNVQFSQGINFFGGRLNLLVSFQLMRAIRKFNPDIIHVHGGRAAFFLGFVPLKIPVVYTVHGLHFLDKRGIVKWFGAIAECWAISRSKIVIFVSYFDLRLAQRFHLLNLKATSGRKQRTFVIYNGTSRLSYKLRGSVVWDVAFIGRLEPMKDPSLFIKIAKCLKSYKCLMIGDGSLKAQVFEELHADGLDEVIDLLGSLPRQEVLKIIPQCRIMVMTSRHEGLPIGLLEAMAAGIPIVAAAVGGVPEIISHGETGFLVSSREPEEFAIAIKKILNNPTLYARMRQASLSRVDQVFSETKMVNSITEIYQRALSS